MGDHSAAPMYLGHSAEVDHKDQSHALPLAQAEVGGLNENPGGAEVDGFALVPRLSRDGYVNRGAGAMPGM